MMIGTFGINPFPERNLIRGEGSENLGRVLRMTPIDRIHQYIMHPWNRF